MSLMKDRLTYARSLIEKGWCKGSYARTKNSRIVNELSDKACKFCALGALSRSLSAVGKQEMYYKGVSILSASTLEVYNFPYGIVNYNDYKAKSKKDVLKVFDHAIANCK